MRRPSQFAPALLLGYLSLSYFFFRLLNLGLRKRDVPILSADFSAPEERPDQPDESPISILTYILISVFLFFTRTRGGGYAAELLSVRVCPQTLEGRRLISEQGELLKYKKVVSVHEEEETMIRSISCFEHVAKLVLNRRLDFWIICGSVWFAHV